MKYVVDYFKFWVYNLTILLISRYTPACLFNYYSLIIKIIPQQLTYFKICNIYISYITLVAEV